MEGVGVQGSRFYSLRVKALGVLGLRFWGFNMSRQVWSSALGAS